MEILNRYLLQKKLFEFDMKVLQVALSADELEEINVFGGYFREEFLVNTLFSLFSCQVLDQRCKNKDIAFKGLCIFQISEFRPRFRKKKW